MTKLLLLFLLVSGFTNAQVLDQDNSAPIGNVLADSSETPGQSFKAGITGQLSTVNVKVNSVTTPGVYNLYLYSGEGMSGTLLGFNSLFIDTVGIKSYNLSPTLSINQDTTYTFKLVAMDGGTINIEGDTNNTYLNGYGYWFDGPAQQLLGDLAFQTFVDTASGAGGCQNPITVSAYLISNELGCTGFNGEAGVNANGGSGPYTYSWAPLGGTGQLTGQVLTQGMYTVTVSDPTGCVSQGNVFISSGTLNVNATANPISCYNSGTVYSNANGGSGPLSYVWSNAATTQDLTGLTNPGQYYVTVSDTTGCIKSDTVILLDYRMDVVLAVYNSTCGNNNAYINATPNASYYPTFYWSGPSGFTSSDQSIFNLAPGVYTLMVTDTVCPTSYDTVIIAASSAITITHTVNNNVSCNGGHDGSATIVVTGAAPGANIYWGTSATGLTANDLGAGYTFVQVNDSLQCMGMDSILITEPPALVGSLSFTEPSCGLNNGNISASVTGGTAPYSYFWNTGNTANNLNGIEAGIYMVDITDANGCMISDIATLGTSGGPTITPSVTNITCNNADNGAISVSLSGGTPPYTIYWTDMDSSYTTLNRTNLQAGPYELVVADVNGCQSIFTTTINEPLPIYPNMNSSSPTACSTPNGFITASVQGGTAPYTYLWSNASTSSSITGLAAGVYSLTVTDANGCTGINIEFLSDPTLLDAYGNDIPTNCGTNTGSIDITVSNGSGSYSYQWTNGATTEDISGLYPGEYGVTITDLFDGCVKALQFGVNSSTANYEPEVCLVTVDTLDEKNIIVWERPTIGGIKEFVIYRETSAPGVYRYIGSNPIDSLTEMKDTLANTDLHTWKYKISAIDSCGVETGVSEIEHRPIYLTVDTNGVGLPSLVWTSYMGRPYSNYVVKRNANGTGWVDVVTLPASQNSFVDLNCPSGIIEYTIEALFTTTCTSTRGAINTTRSNIKTPTSVIVGLKGNTTITNNVSLFPNPSQDNFTVSLANKTKVNVSVEVVNAMGQIVYTTAINESSKSTTINAANWNNGVYFVRINSTEMQSVIKFVKQ